MENLIKNVDVCFSVTTYPLTTGNDDFTAKTQSITFQPGETGPKLIEIGLVDDILVEPTEAFTVSLGASAAQVTLGHAATVNIVDNDGKVFSPICNPSNYNNFTSNHIIISEIR